MSHQENTKLLEKINEDIEQAIVGNDPDMLYKAYTDLIDGGFDTEAESLKEKFQLISSVSNLNNVT